MVSFFFLDVWKDICSRGGACTKTPRRLCIKTPLSPSPPLLNRNLLPAVSKKTVSKKNKINSQKITIICFRPKKLKMYSIINRYLRKKSMKSVFIIEYFFDVAGQQYFSFWDMFVLFWQEVKKVLDRVPSIWWEKNKFWWNFRK